MLKTDFGILKKGTKENGANTQNEPREIKK